MKVKKCFKTKIMQVMKVSWKKIFLIKFFPKNLQFKNQLITKTTQTCLLSKAQNKIWKKLKEAF